MSSQITPITLYNRNVYALYNLLFFLALIVSTPWWLLEMWRHGKYRSGWSERLGSVPQRLRQHSAEPTIWVHAVSVGEVLAVAPVIQALRKELPEWRIVVSTTTDTGQRLARQRFGDANVFYLPLDLPFAVRPYFAALRPKMLLLAESEFWPNLLRWARVSGAAVAVVNARVSDRSLPGYLRFRRLLRRVMQDVDLFLAQSEEDARRLVRIGAAPERVGVSGNLKFDMQPPAESHTVAAIRQAVQQGRVGPVIVAGSTLDPEESAMLAMFSRVLPRYAGALLVLAPRHPERFEAVSAMVALSGIPYQRRSRWHADDSIEPGIFLLDSIGELAAMYQIADLAFVGGSLAPHGGHNIVEAAQFGKAILVGPHTENFRDIVELFRRTNALRVLQTGDGSFVRDFLDLLANSEERKALGQRALEVMRSQQGATAKTVDELLRLLRVPVLAPELPSESRR